MRDQFLNLCHATPFWSFRVHTRDGTAFDVHAPRQVAFSPDGGMIVVVLSVPRFETLVPERIARCEMLHAGTSPIPQAEPEPPLGPVGSPGGITFQSVIDADGRRLIHFEATDADGHVMLSSAGTRWDLYGMKVFENGRTLYPQHADDLTLSQRIILWPPKRGRVESSLSRRARPSCRQAQSWSSGPAPPPWHPRSWRLVSSSPRGGRSSTTGAAWGAMARERDSGIWLHLLHADPARRMEFTPRLAVALATHRFACEGLEGATSISRLQHMLHACRTPEWMREELEEWCGKGKGIPAL